MKEKRHIDWKHSNFYAAIRYLITKRCYASVDVGESITYGYGPLGYGNWEFPLYFRENSELCPFCGSKGGRGYSKNKRLTDCIPVLSRTVIGTFSAAHAERMDRLHRVQTLHAAYGVTARRLPDEYTK